jgi:glucosamine 6-phosphate synthetase-like amidotransferase/phosphosugar isomerase protein
MCPTAMPVAYDIIFLPETFEPIYPILATIRLQLLAYQILLEGGSWTNSNLQKITVVNPITFQEKR